MVAPCGHSRQLTGCSQPRGTQTRAGGGPEGAPSGRVHAVPLWARPEGSSRCPYNFPEAAPQTRGSCAAAAAAGSPGTGSRGGGLDYTRHRVRSRLVHLRPRLPQVLPQLRGSLRRRHRDACPGCATRATRSFPANSVSSWLSLQLTTLGVSCPGRPAL